ncbi:UDP-N-acetylmuramoylalanine--D-glutamate ligase [bacterium BMS3Bbin11]|nr:UDP-N-acetylmuramoylalanine--D-glutamate ligase [bacterium BMS3Abin11]GBE45087.1 UDP-N-acetylmuramoylalanine--D-glutamate ligase [bacterium BMS3Bbin11]GMT39995.1 MAG: UDP-N-acetylmuramoylalanine--D-glutamate ligase [bacterium]
MMNQKINSTPGTPPLFFMVVHRVSGSVAGGNQQPNISNNNKHCHLQGSPTHAAVIGLGQSGLAAAVFLSKQGLDVDVYDSSNKPVLRQQLAQQLPDVQLHCGSLAVEHWSNDSLLVVSPGVPLSHPDLAPLLATGVRPIGDVELFAQCVRSPVIAITGSNGKSTVTALVGEILQHAGRRAAVGGNIGVPVLELLDDDKNDIYVLELSSFQLETTWSLKPAIAVVLNIAADHMDRYSGMDDYIATKLKVYKGSARILMNADEPCLLQRQQRQNMQQSDKEQIFFSSMKPEKGQDYGLSDINGAVYLCRGDKSLIAADDIHIAGQHNQLNVLAAWALASSLGIADSLIKEAVTEFKGLPHRMELLHRINGVDWINDSKGTNVGASVAALRGLQAPVILIAGGIAKDADFTPLREVVKRHVKAIILIGRDARKIQDAVSDIVSTSLAADMSDAVAQASVLAETGDVVILSPACASFDMYQNFEQRGDDFRRCVGRLV